MAKLTITIGVLLALIGIGFYVAAVPHAPTSLIPLYFGVLLVLLGALANSDDPKRRMLFMHIAVAVGLLGFLSVRAGRRWSNQDGAGCRGRASFSS